MRRSARLQHQRETTVKEEGKEYFSLCRKVHPVYGRSLVSNRAIQKGKVVISMTCIQFTASEPKQYMEAHDLPSDVAIQVQQGSKQYYVYCPSMTSLETDSLIETGNLWYLVNHDRHPCLRPQIAKDHSRVDWFSLRSIQKGEVLTFMYDNAQDWLCVQNHK